MNEEKDKHGTSTNKLHRAYHASERYNSAPLEDTLISQVLVFQVL